VMISPAAAVALTAVARPMIIDWNCVLTSFDAPVT